MDKLLTIIVPCFNMEQYLGRCLDSLSLSINNHRHLLEVLVINDGSKDGTSQIAHQYEKDFPDAVKVVDKVNGHYGSCINVGLDIAQGKFVKILEPDDVFDIIGFKLFLSELTKLDNNGKSNEIDLIITDYIKISPSGQVLSKSNFNYIQRRTMDFEEFQSPLKYHILLPAVTYRLSILKEINYHQTEGCPYTDIEWLTIPMHKVRNVIYLPYVVYKYLIGREGQTIEQSTYVRNVNVILRLVSGLLKQYESLIDANRPAVRSYVDKVLLAQIAIIYRTYLIDNVQDTLAEDVREFDNLLRQIAPDLYKKSDFTIETRFFSYHYVNCFRTPGIWSWFEQKLFSSYVRLALLKNKWRSCR